MDLFVVRRVYTHAVDQPLASLLVPISPHMSIDLLAPGRVPPSEHTTGLCRWLLRLVFYSS